MELLRNLLRSMNQKWYDHSKFQKVVYLQQGSGKNRFATIEDGILYLHSNMHSPTFGDFETVDFEGLTIEDLHGTLTAMGYIVDISDAVRKELHLSSALTIVDVESLPLGPGADLTAFTSNFWKVLYPIYQTLKRLNKAMDDAFDQALLPTARGHWLDYWVSFFKINRLPGESDEMLLRRAYLTLSSAKSNNTAMEDLISFYIGTVVQVLDDAPAVMEVRVDPQFMNDAGRVHEIVRLLKSGGVHYFINYLYADEEDYRSFFRDMYGAGFNTINSSPMTTIVSMPFDEEDYSKGEADDYQGFILNKNRLNSNRRLGLARSRINESVTMMMTDEDGTIIEYM